MPRILLVDDDVDLTAMLADYLSAEGFAVAAASDGATGLARALAGDVDLVVLDVMLPDRSGIETLRELRLGSKVPVLMLTARGDEIDKVVGLELGADDYVPKPCTPRELAARIRAILRRTTRFTGSSSGTAVLPAIAAADGGIPTAAATGAPPIAQPDIVGAGVVDDGGRTGSDALAAGALRIWPRSRRAQWQGRDLALTSTQFSVLEVLVRHAGTVVSKAELSKLALGRPLGRFDRSLDVHISILRQRLDGPDGGDALIKTVRGVGYQLAVG